MDSDLNGTLLPLVWYTCKLPNGTDVCGPTTEEVVNSTLVPEVDEGPILKDQKGVIITCTFMTIIWFIGVFGNAAVIMTYRKKYDRFSSHLFLFALGVIDFMACFFLLPQSLFIYVISKNDTHSTFVSRLIFLVIVTSVLLLMGMAIDRTTAIRNPFNFDAAKRRVKGIITGAILLAALVTLLYVIDKWVGIVIGTSVVILSFLVMIAMYSAIPFYVIGHWRSRSTVHPAAESPPGMNQASTSQSQQRRVEPLPSTSGIVSKPMSPTTGLQNIILLPRIRKRDAPEVLELEVLPIGGKEETTCQPAGSWTGRDTQEGGNTEDRWDEGSHTKALHCEENKKTALRTAQIAGTTEPSGLPDIDTVRVEALSENTQTRTRSHGSSGMNQGDSVLPQIWTRASNITSLSQLEVPISQNNLRIQHQIQQQKLRRHLLKTMRLLFSISLVYIISFLPTLMSVFSVFDLPVYFRNTYYISHAANPIIYSFMNREFRKYLADLRRGTAMCCRH